MTRMREQQTKGMFGGTQGWDGENPAPSIGQEATPIHTANRLRSATCSQSVAGSSGGPFRVSIQRGMLPWPPPRQAYYGRPRARACDRASESAAPQHHSKVAQSRCAQLWGRT
jgi:hypothetical protein